mmetsp:Transcript_7407/g.11706  ORF Transcript_7407/g.11706 Transcript_7407/m.11706 type:complete len:106 (-) Transcript_7407:99-416(-)
MLALQDFVSLLLPPPECVEGTRGIFAARKSRFRKSRFNLVAFQVEAGWSRKRRPFIKVKLNQRNSGKTMLSRTSAFYTMIFMIHTILTCSAYCSRKCESMNIMDA